MSRNLTDADQRIADWVYPKSKLPSAKCKRRHRAARCSRYLGASIGTMRLPTARPLEDGRCPIIERARLQFAVLNTLENIPRLHVLARRRSFFDSIAVQNAVRWDSAVPTPRPCLKKRCLRSVQFKATKPGASGAPA